MIFNCYNFSNFFIFLVLQLYSLSSQLKTLKCPYNILAQLCGNLFCNANRRYETKQISVLSHTSYLHYKTNCHKAEQGYCKDILVFLVVKINYRAAIQEK